MHFAEPYWLLAGAIVVAALFALRIRGERLTNRALVELSGARLVSAGTLPSPFRRWLRVFVICLAVAAGFVALARPQKGMSWQTLDRKGTDLLLVVDTSKSMNADDISPTRLQRTKLAIQDLVQRFPEDRIGLMAFAGDAYLESPLTLDHGALIETLNSFDTSTISRPGTDIGRAIDSGVAALKADSGNEKVMVLLTDGEDLAGQGLDAAKRAAAAGITIQTVGVGTPAGELVPAKNDDGATIGVMRDESGAPVRSRLDESGLRAIAESAHGTYRALGADGRGLDRLYAEALAPLAHLEKGAKVRRVYAEWFALPLGLSLFGIVLDALLAFRPRKRRESKPKLGGSTLTHSAAAAAAAIALLLPARAHASVRSAQQAYQGGKFEDAQKQYEAERASQPNDARLAVDEGAAAYRAGHFDVAEASLSKALALADPKLQERVLYDLGDARYRLGGATLKDAPEKTIERWKAAITAYEGALKLTPNDADARFNRDLVKRKLAELEQKQKQDQQKQDQQKQDQQKQDQKAGQQKQGQQNQKPGQQKQDGQNQKPDQQKQGPNGKPQGKNGSNKSDDSAGQGQTQNQPGNAKGQPADQSQNQPNKSGPRPAPAGQGDGQGASGDSAGKSDGKLSPKDARALLNSLRGDERQVRFGNTNAAHDDDTPKKDW